MSENYGMSYSQWWLWQDDLDGQADAAYRYQQFKLKVDQMRNGISPAELFNERFQNALDLDGELETLVKI